MVPLTLILIYAALFCLIIYAIRKTTPLKWNLRFHRYMKTFSYQTGKEGIFLIPGPIVLPVLGTKWQNIKMNKLHEYYKDLNETYGDVVLEMSGTAPVVSLFNRKDIEKVLGATSKYPFRPPTEIITFYRKTRPDRYASPGLAHSQGPEWANLRSKLSQKTLESRQFMKGFCPALNEICDDFLCAIKQKRNTVDILNDFELLATDFTLEAACTLSLGRRNSSQKTSDKNSRDLKEAGKEMNEILRDSYFGSSLWKYFPTKIYQNFVKVEDKIYDTVSEIISKTLKENEDMAEDKENMSILSRILKTDGLDDRDKISGIIDFISASFIGINTIIFLLYYISINPEVQEKIYQESLTMKDGIDFEDLSTEAHYARATIHETFRISPVAFALARILVKDLVLGGYHMKAGTVVLCQNMIACRKEENFERPMEFIPERWLNEKGEMCMNNQNASSIVMPFGTGKRICPGKKFIEMELIILVTKLVRTFKLEYCSPFEEVFEFVLAPKSPVNIKFTDRV